MQRIMNSIFCVLVILVMVTSISNAAPPATGGYIVVLHDRAGSPSAVAEEITQQIGGRVGYIYEHALKGFSITLPPETAAVLENNPNVKYVATDDIRYISAQEVPTGIQRIFAESNGNIEIDGTDDYRVDVDVAVIDTGIDFEHPDLDVVGGVDCTVFSGGGPPWARSYYCSQTEGTRGDDDHYHGTHVAGTIGAIDNGFGVVGVAPGARLWAVKVLDSGGSGYSSNIIAGIDWITAQGSIAVANMSLGGDLYNQAEYDAIQGAVEAGVAFAVAAGNNNDDAGKYSLAGFGYNDNNPEGNVLTVSALADFDGEPGGKGSPTCLSDDDDTLVYFSNWGSVIGIAAPGACILSTYPIEQGYYGTISGTSMASPHVAGALALLASANKPGNADDVYDLYDLVINAGNSEWVDDSGDGFKEPLLDVSTFLPKLIESDGEAPPVNTKPIVIIKSPEDGGTFESGKEILFSGTASDNEDINLDGDDLVWVSSIEGEIGTGDSFSTVLSDGDHTITASVTDSGNLTGSDSITITVNAASGGDISLSVSASKVRGAGVAKLTWSGATLTNVDIYRESNLIVTTAATTGEEPGNGEYTDESLSKGGGSATYQVCEEQTAACSNEVSVSW